MNDKTGRYTALIVIALALCMAATGGLRRTSNKRALGRN
jgi:hypothetical protein